MPNISMTIPETVSSVIRPVVLDIIHQLVEITKLPVNVPVYLPGAAEAIAQKGATMLEMADNTGKNTRLDYNTQITIRVSESYPEERVLSTSISNFDNPPIFLDPLLGVMLRPAYMPTAVTVSVEFTGQSYNQCKRWRDDIRARTSRSTDIKLHRASYHYPVPDFYIELVKEIWTKRELTAGYGDAFEDYLANNGTNRFTVVSNQIGTHTLYAIAETQSRIIGMFDFNTAPPQSERKDNSGAHTTSFDYNFTFDKPTEINAIYPILVHNSFIADKYIVRDTAPDENKINQFWSESTGALRFMEATQINKQISVQDTPFILPAEDYWFLPSSQVPFTTSILYALCQIDVTRPNLAINLNELGDYMLDPDIANFITNSEYSFCTKLHQSIIQISMYDGNEPISATTSPDADLFSTLSIPNVVVDTNLNVTTRMPLNLRTNNRLRLSLVNDMQMLSNSALKRLKMYPTAARKIFAALGFMPRDFAGIAHKCDFSNIVPEYAGAIANDTRYLNNPGIMRTIMVGYIVGLRADQMDTVLDDNIT